MQPIRSGPIKACRNFKSKGFATVTVFRRYTHIIWYSWSISSTEHSKFYCNRLRNYLLQCFIFICHHFQMCETLERMHPRVYMNISRHLSRAPFGELEEAHTAPYLLNAVAKDLFKNGINWAKIVSIFTVSGGLAVDIVRQGHYDYLPRLIETTGDIVEDDLVPWLMEHGGWSGLLEHIRPNYCYFNQEFTPYQWITIATAVLFGFYAVAFIVRAMSCIQT